MGDPAMTMGDASGSGPRGESPLDLRGLHCPMPVLRTRKALRDVPIGGTVEIACTDPLTRIDIPNFCREAGHELESETGTGELFVFRIVRRR